MSLAATVEASAGLISRQRLRQAATGPGRERSVQALLDPRRSLISALQLVQAITIALAVSLITVVLLRGDVPAAALFAVVIVSLVFLIFGQAIPRALARTRPSATAGFLLGLSRLLTTVVRPLSAIGDATANVSTRILGGERPDATPIGSEDELLLMTRDPDDDGIIEPEERVMIDNVLQLEATAARDIMVPRVD